MAFTGPHGEPIVINGSAPDVSGRPETSVITSVQFTPQSFYIRHTKEATWPEPIPPGWEGGVQYTSWIVVNVGGTWYTTGCLEFWKTAPDDPFSGSWKGGDPAPFSKAAADWWYHASPQNTTQPGPGQTVGVFVTAGSQRMKDVTAPGCAERSNIVWVVVPPADSGLFTFDSTPVVPPEPIPPAPSGITLDDVMVAIQGLEELQSANTAEIVAHQTSETDRVIQRLNELRQEVIDFAEIAGKVLLAKWLKERHPDDPPLPF